MRVFLAGANGASGRRLVPLLIAAGHRCHRTTRSAEAARKLEAAGVHPAIVDVYDAAALQHAAVAAQPEAVIHQLTDLPQTFDEKELSAVVSAQCARPGRRHAQFDRGRKGGATPDVSSCKASRSPMRPVASRTSRTIRSIFPMGRVW